MRQTFYTELRRFVKLADTANKLVDRLVMIIPLGADSLAMIGVMEALLA
jgi:hypothetical protein